MSSNPIPRRTLLFSLLGLAGCGLTPIYGTGGGYGGKIAYEGSNSVIGFRLRKQLEQRLGVSTEPQYTLRATVRNSERAAAITSAGDTSRFNIIGTATWSLTEISTGQQIDSGQVQTFTSYSATGSTIATQSTRDDAQARLSAILADMITTRILALTYESTT